VILKSVFAECEQWCCKVQSKRCKMRANAANKPAATGGSRHSARAALANTPDQAARCELSNKVERLPQLEQRKPDVGQFGKWLKISPSMTRKLTSISAIRLAVIGVAIARKVSVVSIAAP
jgi:hypothetical protein